MLAVSFYNGADNLDNSRNTANTFEGRNGNGGRTINNNTSDVLNWGNWGSSLRWARQWSPRFYSNAVVAYSNYFSERDRITDITTSTEDTVRNRRFGTVENNNLIDYTARIDNEWVLGQRHRVGFGTQVTYNEITYDLEFNDTLNILSRADEGTQAAFYLQDIWSLTDRLSLTGGLRATYFDVTVQFFYEPRASATLQLTDRLKLKGAWGDYYQIANRVVREDVTQGSRDFWLLANDQTNPVSSATHYIAGLSYESDTYLFDVEYYEKDMTGLSEFSLRFSNPGRDPTEGQLFFEGTGIARGVEFLLQKKVGDFTGWVSYTLGEVVHNFPDLSENAFYALHDQRHELKLVGSYNLGSWTFASTWIYATGKPYTAPYGEYELTLLDGSNYRYISVGE